MKNQPNQNSYERSLNTLAQIGTPLLSKKVIIVQGKGSDLSDTRSLKGKSKRKLITQKMVLSLLDVSKKSKSGTNKKGYWNTYYCQQHVYTADKRVYGKYCKNRFCTLCCANRKADIINRYLPVVQTWEKPHFVTVTIKSVPYYKLNAVMKSMIKEFRKIVAIFRKRNQRGTGIKLVGIRALESNYNPVRKTYNPHFHCIVASKEMAEILVKEWLLRSKPGWTNTKAQDIKPVFNNVAALIEVVKYGSKIFTEPDITQKKQRKGSEKIYAVALNNIFNAMRGLRIFERFGCDLPKQCEAKLSRAKVVKDYNEWSFHAEDFDWVNIENGDRLTHYKPPDELVNMLENCMDIELD